MVLNHLTRHIEPSGLKNNPDNIDYFHTEQLDMGGSNVTGPV